MVAQCFKEPLQQLEKGPLIAFQHFLDVDVLHMVAFMDSEIVASSHLTEHTLQTWIDKAVAARTRMICSLSNANCNTL